MNPNKRYLHDKLILLLLTVATFLAVLGSLLIVLRLNNGGQGSDYIVQYRSNLGLSAFQSGGVETFFEFIIFMVAVLTISIIVSVKIYPLRKVYSVSVLAMCVLLLFLSIIVSNALLVLR